MVVGAGEVEIEEDVLRAHRRDVHALLENPREDNGQGEGEGESKAVDMHICILDGFLLYPDPKPHNVDSNPSPSLPHSLTSLLQLRLFLRSTLALTRARRAARPGYVTLDGFWADPPGYVEEVVWPNYVREHAWMFEGGDVEGGEVREGVGREGMEGREGEGEGEGIWVGPGKGEVSMQEILRWAVGVLRGRVE